MSTLEQLATLAAHPFASPEAAAAAVLDLICRTAGLRTAFLARTNRGRFEVAAADDREGCPFAAGDELPLAESYCAIVVQTGQPLTVEDARRQQPFAGMPITKEKRIGSYLGVPLLLSSGEVYGTLCAVDPAPRQFTSEQTALLVLLARLAAFPIEQAQLAADRDRRTREAERARSEIRAVVDTVSDAIVLLSPERRIAAFNRRAAELFGLDRERLLGKRVEEARETLEQIFADAGVLDPARYDAAPADRRFAHVVAQRWPARRELHLFSVPVTTGSGDHLGRLFVFHDVTREREADQMKSDFVSLVSHELRTPLTSIKGYIDLLLDGDAGGLAPDHEEYLGVAKNNADRLVGLINELLDLSRIESGKTELRRTTVNLGAQAQAAVAALRPLLQSKRQELVASIAPGLPLLSADPDRVAQILTNLIANAHRSSGAGARIRLTVSQEGGVVRVDVQDEGMALNEEEQAQIFNKFFRAKNTAVAEAGAGLGLAITRLLVEMHGGAISVASAPGHGSTFTVTLPASAPLPQRAAEQALP